MATLGIAITIGLACGLTVYAVPLVWIALAPERGSHESFPLLGKLIAAAIWLRSALSRTTLVDLSTAAGSWLLIAYVPRGFEISLIAATAVAGAVLIRIRGPTIGRAQPNPVSTREAPVPPFLPRADDEFSRLEVELALNDALSGRSVLERLPEKATSDRRADAFVLEFLQQPALHIVSIRPEAMAAVQMLIDRVEADDPRIAIKAWAWLQRIERAWHR